MHSRESSVVSLGRLAGTTDTHTTLLGGEANVRFRLSASLSCVSASNLLSTNTTTSSPALRSAFRFNRSLHLMRTVCSREPSPVGSCGNAESTTPTNMVPSSAAVSLGRWSTLGSRRTSQCLHDCLDLILVQNVALTRQDLTGSNQVPAFRTLAQPGVLVHLTFL